MQDPFGSFIVLLRDYAPIAAIVSGRVSANALAPPSIRLRAAPTDLVPFGPGSSSVGVQKWTGLAFCYGRPDTETGEQEARILAGHVCDRLHGLGGHRGTSGALLIRVWTPTIGEILRDPDTKWPYHTVRIEAYAAAQAVA